MWARTAGGGAVCDAKDVLQRLVIRNFRSLESLEVEFDPLVALVGPNGSGKSSLLRAADIALGPRYPSLGSFAIPHDFTRLDDTQELTIRARLDAPVPFRDKQNKDHEIHGVEVRLAPYKVHTKRGEPGDLHCTYVPLSKDGKPPIVALNIGKGGPNFGPLTSVPSEVRDATRALFIDHRRSVTQHQPWTRGSILARLLGPVRRQLDEIEFEPGISHLQAFSERYQSAMDALRTSRVQEIEETISVSARRMLGFLGSTAIADLDVRFGFADPANPFGTLRLNYLEHGLELPAEDLGSGVQSAIVVGIFEAFRQLGVPAGTVLIEEPEMYLHPQAQRYFHRLLIELVETGQCQVIYSTHSPIFADVTHFEALRLVRREPGSMTGVNAVTDDGDRAFLAERREAQKLLAFTSARSEAFFARRVLLVEGVGDVIAIRMLADRQGIDLDAEDLAVVDCGSKSAIPFVARVCRALGIPVLALHDQDIYEPAGDDDARAAIVAQNEAETTLNQLIAETIGDPENLFVVRPSLEAELGISVNARDKPRRIAEALHDRGVRDWPSPVRDALTSLSIAGFGPDELGSDTAI